MADLTCRELVELVTDYLDGALGEDATNAFEQHLALCPGCVTYLDQMRETASLLGTIPEETISEDARATLLAAFRGVRG